MVPKHIDIGDGEIGLEIALAWPRVLDVLLRPRPSRGRFLPMSETSNYYSSTSGHLCDLDHCTLRTSLKLHTFDRRFYGCRYWSPGDDRACKFFKWLDTNTCTRGAATTPIVLAKLRRLEHEVELANEELGKRVRWEKLQNERLKEPRLRAGFSKRKRRSSR
ncbi:hypothetical protein SO802_016885 [Lithocarpus litseifolius]|uniref:Zinc finger GRF-type domain-containing protein n=1 Tax=Lithocarpus litseifolius TaxID=425828 RepID=A0AAW2CYF5_9ROSI